MSFSVKYDILFAKVRKIKRVSIERIFMIGREEEQAVLMELAKSDHSELAVVYGRRRVGKTFLVRETFGYEFDFSHTGVENGTLRDELFAFWDSLRDVGHECERPKDWWSAFGELKAYLRKRPNGKKVVFLDELPWMDTHKSGFVKALESFWNGWASARRDIFLIVCGSAAAWMVKNVLQSRGGLFNRASRQIFLHPFTLGECERFVKSKGVEIARGDVVEAYMVFGGAAYYWGLLEKDESLAQNIDRLFFSENGDLAHEFSRLYRSVFSNPDPYIAVVAALGERKAGMTREDLVASSGKLVNNGNLSTCLDNLERSGFVRRYVPIGGKKNNALIQLTDNFTLFHFKFISENIGGDKSFWTHFRGTPAFSAWEGLAFERVCLAHIDQIRVALGISGVATKVASWRCRGNSEGMRGAQIDLVISRADNIVNICEMKFARGQYEIDADEADRLRNRTEAFRRETGFRGGIHLTFITPYGVKRNKYWNMVQSEVTLDDLFRE